MSIEYDLFCGECLETLHLGKILMSSEGSEDWHFGGWMSDEYDDLSGDRLLGLVQRFLIIHRRHDICVLSEGDFDVLLDQIGPAHPLVEISNVRKYLRRDPGLPAESNLTSTESVDAFTRRTLRRLARTPEAT